MAANWTDVPDSDVDPESPITTSLMQALRDNPEGIAGGVAGAPRIVYGALNLSNDLVQGDIANSAIGQGELKTATGTVAQTSNGSTIATLPGGQYGFYPRSRFDQADAGTTNEWMAVVYGQVTSNVGGSQSSITEIQRSSNTDGDQAFGPYIYLVNDTAVNNYHVDAEQTYIQASPPYDLGDGECGLFVECDIRGDGKIASLWMAPDPVWANNGPTNIRPDRIDRKTGKKYKSVRRPELTRKDLIEGRCDLTDYIAAQKEASIEEIEVTPEFKRSDMEIVPHSWASPPQGTICLLDPVNTHDLLALHEAGEDVADLIHRGYIQIGDECKRCGPPGVVPVSWKWRNSR